MESELLINQSSKEFPKLTFIVLEDGPDHSIKISSVDNSLDILHYYWKHAKENNEYFYLTLSDKPSIIFSWEEQGTHKYGNINGNMTYRCPIENGFSMNPSISILFMRDEIRMSIFIMNMWMNLEKRFKAKWLGSSSKTHTQIEKVFDKKTLLVLRPLKDNK
jgi:hypothetical protein